jgi:dipeptidyl aminopeptidase/acylaminoacyl peptidase
MGHGGMSDECKKYIIITDMKKVCFFGMVIICLLGSCKKQPVTEEIDFSGQLTEAEVQYARLTPEILWKYGRVADAQLSPDGASVIYNVTRYNVPTNKSVTDIWKVSTTGGEPEKLTGTDGKYLNPRWNPSGTKIGYLSSQSGTFQIWEMNPDGTGAVRKSDYPAGINSFEYSPDGSKILFTSDVKLDKATTDIYTDLPMATGRIIDDLMYRHWNDWSDYKYSHIFYASLKDGMITEATDIMKEEPWDSPLSPFFDAAEISWSPDGKMIAYTCKKMKGKEYAISTNSDIYLYDLESGSTENITKGMSGYDKYPVFSNNSGMIAWQSMETPGYEADKERLFITDLTTGDKKYLTRDFDQNAASFVWAQGDRRIYFISGIYGTYQVYFVDLESGEIKQLTSGIHDYSSLSLKGDVLVGTRQSMSMATEIFRIHPETGEEVQLTYTNKNINDHIKMGRVQGRWIKTTDQKNMLVWVIYPPDFDSLKQYPAILFCQGGPQSAVSQTFHFRWNFQIMAANDYIVVAPNRRGLPTFGEEWNEQISGDYGGQNMKDYFSAIDALKKEPYVDENRLGAVGASYGGYSVFWLAGHHEGRFKAFIAHCGIYNFESAYGATEEYFFVNHDYEGPYWEKPKPKSYEFSPHLAVQNWDTPILIITGQNDFRIPYTQSLEAFNAAQLRGVTSRLLFFPDETHFVLKPQNSILWQREFFGWLDQWLK